MLLDTPKVMALKELKKLPRGTPILDVGFGRGEMLKELHKLGFGNLVGTETSSEMIEEVKKKLPGVILVKTDNPARTCEEFSSRITLCFEVIEHLKNPDELLKNFPQGRLFLSTPNIDRWWPKLTGHYESWDFPPNHLSRWNEPSLRGLLYRTGFTNIKIRPTPVSYNRILQPVSTYLAFRFGLKANTENYETVRGSRIPIRPLYRFARLASFPVTIPIAWGLNRLGYVGESFYATAEKQ